MRIEQSPLSVRAKTALMNAGYDTVEKCETLKEGDLFKIRNLGKKTVLEILNYLDLLQEPKSSGIVNGQRPLSEERFEYLASILSIPISDIFLSVRAKNTMDDMRIGFLKDLVASSPYKIIQVKNSGKKTLDELTSLLNKLNLQFGMELPADVIMEAKRRIAITRNAGASLQAFKKKYPEKEVVFDDLKIRIISRDKIEHYKKLYDLYKKGGTLESVAKEVGLTRERVRQIFVKGTKYGLFNYRGHEYPYVPKDRLEDSIMRQGSLYKVATKFKISAAYLKRLLVTYRIDKKTIDELVLNGRKQKAIDEFRQVKETLGHDPTTTELQAIQKWRALWARIVRYWGSIDAFRIELNIPRPPQGNPLLKDHVAQWREQRMKIALLKRMQRLDDIRDFLGDNKEAQSSEIAINCNIKQQSLWHLLMILQSTGEIKKIGEGSQTKYRLT